MNVPLPDEKAPRKLPAKLIVIAVLVVLVIGSITAALMRREIAIAYHVSFLTDRLAEENIHHEVALAQMQPPPTARLIGYLYEPDFDAKAAVVRVLTIIRPVETETLDTLIDLLVNGEAKVSRYSAKALASVGAGNPVVIDAITRIVVSPDSPADTRTAGLMTLQQLSPQDPDNFVEFLNDLLYSDSDAPFVAIFGALVASGDPAVPLLAGLLYDRNVHFRRGAARALTELGPTSQPAIPALLYALRNDEDVEIRYQAAIALRRIHHSTPQVLEALRHSIETEPGSAAGVASIGVLTSLAPDAPETLALLHELIQPERLHQQRRMALDTLAHIGPPAAAALPTLHIIAVEEEGITRSFARHAITSITGQAPPPSSELPPLGARVTQSARSTSP